MASIDVKCSKMFPTLNEATLGLNKLWQSFSNCHVIWRCHFCVNIHCLFEVFLFLEIAMVIMHNNSLQTVGFFSPNRFSVAEESHAREALES